MEDVREDPPAAVAADHLHRPEGGAALAATAAVVTEFVGSDKGLGYLILEYNGFIEIPLVFACIVLLSAIGLALYYAVESIERLTIPWHVSQQHDDTGLGAS